MRRGRELPRGVHDVPVGMHDPLRTASRTGGVAKVREAIRGDHHVDVVVRQPVKASSMERKAFWDEVR